MSEHRCRSGRDCASRTSDGAAVTVKPDTLCPQCVETIQRCLDELPHLALGVNAFLGGSTKIAFESKVSRTAEPAPPLNLNAFTLLEDIGEALDFANGYRIVDLIRQPAEIFQVWIKGTEQKAYLDGVDRALRIRRVHQKASGLVGLHRVWQRRHAPCPACRLPTLGMWAGSDTVECTNNECQHRMPLYLYEHYCYIEGGNGNPIRDD